MAFFCVGTSKCVCVSVCERDKGGGGIDSEEEEEEEERRGGGRRRGESFY